VQDGGRGPARLASSKACTRDGPLVFRPFIVWCSSHPRPFAGATPRSYC